MHSIDVLGAATSSFTCSANGTCTGTTQTTQRAFIALQTQINRLAPAYGITRLATDGKLGPQTLRSMTNLAGALSRKLGTSVDPIIEQIVFGFGDGAPTSTRDLALSAEEITAALERDGAKPQAWSVLQSIKDMAQQVIATGNAQPSVPPLSPPSTPIDPYPSTTTVIPPTVTVPTAYPPTPPAGWYGAWPGWNPPTNTAITTWRPPLWAVGMGIGIILAIIATGVAIARGRAS